MSLSVQTFAQSSIKADVPNLVGLDEQFKVTFVVDGEDKPSDFQWEPGEDFQLVWGPTSGSSTSIQIINGKKSKSSQYTYTYILAPKKAGTFSIAPATATVKGKAITSSRSSIEVVSDGASSSRTNDAATQEDQSVSRSATGDISKDDLFLKFSISRTNAVIGEPLTASLKLYQRVDIAGLEGAKFPSFNGFWSQETETPTNIEFVRESLNDKIYNVALLRRYVLIPQQAGDLRIDPAELVCVVNVKVPGQRSQSIFDSFFDNDYRTLRKRIVTSPTIVHVRQLPGGAPDSFTGGVGKFSVSARLSKDQLKTHDATSLIVDVAGTGNVSLVTAPKVNFPADMDVYETKVTDNSSKSSGGTTGSKSFEYPFIPRSHGEFTIEPIEFSYYDVNASKYVTVRTEPISFSVEKGSENAAPSSVSPSLPAVSGKGVKSLDEDIRYIVTRKPSLEKSVSFIVAKTVYWIILLLLAAAAAMGYFLLRGAAARRADVAGTKNRRATKMALSRLKLAGDFLHKNLYSAFYEELHKALLGFISDKLNLGAEELNKETIASRLTEAAVPQELSDKFVELIDACEYARYSPDGGNAAMTAHYNDAVSVISSIASVMKKKNSAGALAIVMPLMIFACTISAGAQDYRDSLWNAATGAYSEGRWEDAASAYENLLDVAGVSPQLYYNIGNAFFKAGEYHKAILNYERALKADPSYSDARFNLSLANERIQDRLDAVPEFIFKTWMRNVCYLLSSNAWAVLSIICFGLFLALGLLYLLASSHAARKTGFYGAVGILLLFCLSLGFSKWQSGDYLKADAAIVMKPVSSVKSSPSGSSAKDLFVLHEGTKVKVLDSVGEWVNIELSDGRQGWVRNGEIEVI